MAGLMKNNVCIVMEGAGMHGSHLGRTCIPEKLMFLNVATGDAG